ncbi:MAG: hypothetical protein JWQ90_3121 [Hydrocarboniphaga sp.]|uniref:hypothetical protein n=1 Tax=Hydrocarboniphaga sp. TaxID=2033016 RepID=UPI00262613B6|nr:hypothetical protein [Hydrocarboniphaga sp.]MDB5970671.1 hypothetical protein [Hydrocarboniphaga sp.]
MKPATPRKAKPGWSDIKAQLAEFDRAGLLGLVQDLYAVSKDNQTFLHARFGSADDVLKPYKATIQRWLWPDVTRNQNISVSTAKKAIADYRKAIARPAELAELMVFYCEQAAGFSNDVGLEDEGYFNALVRMFEQALKQANTLPDDERDELAARLDDVRHTCSNFGYGVSEDMSDLMAKAGFVDLL